jgi:hypothetical protein
MLDASAIAGENASELDSLVAALLEAATPTSLVTRIWVAEAGPDIGDDTVPNLMTVPDRLGIASQQRTIRPSKGPDCLL